MKHTSMKYLPLLLLYVSLFFPFSLFAAAAAHPQNVVVVANANDPESADLARYYMKGRDIPPENLLLLPLSHDEEISWETFSTSLWNPLLRKLSQNGWLEGTPVAGTDPAGRERLRGGKSKIGYLVLCRGVPLRIREEPRLNAPRQGNLPSALFSSVAAVDSELALLASEKSETGSYVLNPLFGIPAPSASLLAHFVRVARLDGPSFEDCRQLAANALLAEKNGLAGRAYIDTGGGPYPEGEQLLNSTASLLEKAGFDVSLENSPLLFDYDRRADGAAFYFGWYTKNAAGTFGAPAFRFSPGAIAAHLHSFSAETLRSETQGWTGPLVARGATVSLGNVAEPYLTYTTHFPVFAGGLLRGMQVGEAYAYATPAWSWQTILVGDPLYTPLKLSAAEQLAHLKKNPAAVPSIFRDYILIRSANLLSISGKKTEAKSLLADAVRKTPSPALRLALARAANHAILAWSSADDNLRTDFGLLVETVRYLRNNGAVAEPLALYDVILKHPRPPARIREKLLREAVAFAKERNFATLAAEWEKLLLP
jgi:uncharacterized protein (TIGR03790 family)